MLRSRVTRRKFMCVSATAGAATFAVPAFVRAKSPNEKLNVAVIGPAGRGSAQLEAAGTMENVVAICDVDEKNLAAVAPKYPKAKTYADFRKLLGEMEKSIDAVMVSTPDHTHAPASAMAMRMGKHCYCEKPLTHDVHEARVLANLAKEKKLVTQMGNQIHASENYRRVVELVQAGAIGPVTRSPGMVTGQVRRTQAADGNAPGAERPRLGSLARPAPPFVPTTPATFPSTGVVGGISATEASAISDAI